jgi:branched-chain amino acid transport system ATP-binding protein
VSSAPLLEVHDVVRTFGGLHAVDHASFTVGRGSITALIGPNGAGKTTLFHIIAGFLSADSGNVVYAGRPILGKPAHTIASMRIVRTFQQTRTLTAMTVLDNMLLAGSHQPGERLGGSVIRPLATRRRERELKTRALDLLAQFELAQKASDYAGTLSGGQRKLLELARALMIEPRLMLLDEPMAGINPTLGVRLMEHIQRLRRDHDMTFLFVEHDMDVVMNHADHVVVMASGRVIAADAPHVVRDDPGVIDAYLGTHHRGLLGNS